MPRGAQQGKCGQESLWAHAGRLDGLLQTMEESRRMEGESCAGYFTRVLPQGGIAGSTLTARAWCKAWDRLRQKLLLSRKKGELPAASPDVSAVQWAQIDSLARRCWMRAAPNKQRPSVVPLRPGVVTLAGEEWSKVWDALIPLMLAEDNRRRRDNPAALPWAPSGASFVARELDFWQQALSSFKANSRLMLRRQPEHKTAPPVAVNGDDDGMEVEIATVRAKTKRCFAILPATLSSKRKRTAARKFEMDS